MRSVKEADVKNKYVLVRVDFNVPLKKGKVADDERIRAALPTIVYLRKKKAKIILMSHLGRPGGKVVDGLRMKPVAKKLSTILKSPVHYVTDCIGSDVEDAVHAMDGGDILLLENLRFHPEEKRDSKPFAKQLAALASVYVNDAFGTCHRAHASVHAITKFIPSYAGLLLQKEVDMLTKLLKAPKRPFIAIIGGAKVDTKLGVIRQLLKKVDALLLGSALAAAFYDALKKKGANELKTLLKKGKKKIMLPIDVITAPSLSAKKGTVRSVHEKTKQKWLDIGPETCAIYAEIIKNAKTVFWNGPVGAYENRAFSAGTRHMAKAMAGTKATTVAGGGDIIAAVKKFKVDKKITYLSTGGGASLEFLEGKKLPGIKALK